MAKYTYDKHRGNSAERGYGHEHRKRRKEYLQRHKLCADCKRRRATHLDEIIAGLGHVTGNIQGLCGSCHSRKTALHDGGFGHSIFGGLSGWLKKLIA